MDAWHLARPDRSSASAAVGSSLADVKDRLWIHLYLPVTRVSKELFAWCEKKTHDYNVTRGVTVAGAWRRQEALTAGTQRRAGQGVPVGFGERREDDKRAFAVARGPGGERRG